MDLIVESSIHMSYGKSQIVFKGTRSDGHIITLVLGTDDPEDVNRFPVGTVCTLTVDRKIGNPLM